jgi:hypothetical protein
MTVDGIGPAAAVAAGIAGVLMEQFRKDVPNRAPRSDEIRAILIHSARDLGPPGPDVVFGWGLIDANAAGEVIHGFDPEGPRMILHGIKHASVAEDEEVVFRFRSGPVPPKPTVRPPRAPIRVTLTWIDPPGSDWEPYVLQNDLDLELETPTGQKCFPYRIGRAHPDVPAMTDGPNRVDNVERIDVWDPADGQWVIRVRGTKLRAADHVAMEKGRDGRPRQGFTLICSGIIPEVGD